MRATSIRSWCASLARLLTLANRPTCHRVIIAVRRLRFTVEDTHATRPAPPCAKSAPFTGQRSRRNSGPVAHTGLLVALGTGGGVLLALWMMRNPPGPDAVSLA